MKKAFILVLLSIILNSCAPFEVNWDGSKMTATGRLPRKFESTKEISIGEGITKNTEKYSVKSDNKLSLLPALNFSLANFGGSVSKD